MYIGNGAQQPLSEFSAAQARAQNIGLGGGPRPELEKIGRPIPPGPFERRTGAVDITQGAYTAGRITGPVRFINKLLDAWQLDRNSAIALLGFEEDEKEMVFDILDGLKTLTGKDVKYRITQLFRIRQMLWALFRDRDIENQWLRQPQNELNNSEPLNLLIEGSIENLLMVRQLVQKMAGR